MDRSDSVRLRASSNNKILDGIQLLEECGYLWLVVSVYIGKSRRIFRD